MILQKEIINIDSLDIEKNKIKKEKWDEMQKQFNFLLNSVE